MRHARPDAALLGSPRKSTTGPPRLRSRLPGTTVPSPHQQQLCQQRGSSCPPPAWGTVLLPRTCACASTKHHDPDTSRRSSNARASTSKGPDPQQGREACQAAPARGALAASSCSKRGGSIHATHSTSLIKRWTRLKAAVQGLLSNPHDPLIISLAAPAILAVAAEPLLAIADTALVGQLGPIELAAFSVNTSLFTFAFLVFNFLQTTTCPAVAQALSAGNREQAGEIIKQALTLALVLGAGVAGLLSLQATPVLGIMGVEPDAGELYSLALQFLLIRSTAAPAALIVSTCQGAFRGVQDLRTPLLITVATNVLHLGLSIGLIFQLRMGLPGAALSTSLSEWAAAAAYLGVGWSRRSEVGLGGVQAGGGTSTTSATAAGQGIMSSYAPFLRAGGAVLLRTGLLLGTKTLASSVAMRLGPTSMASHQVLMQVWLFSSLAIDSLAIAGQVAVAVNKGKGDLVQAREVSDRLIQLGVGLGSSLALVLLATGPVWPRVFSQDAEIIATVQALTPVALAMLPVNAVVYVLDGVFVGAGDFSFLVRAMMAAAATGAPLLLAVSPLHLGLEGVWAGLSMLMFGRVATLLWRYNAASGPVPPLAAHSSSGAEGRGGSKKS